MKKSLTLLFYILCVFLIYARPVEAEDRLRAVKDAMTRFICYQKFWMNNDYVEGASIAMDIKFEGEKFYVWTNDEPARSYGRILHFSSFYSGRIKNGKGAITFTDGYNKELNEVPLQLQEFKKHFISGPIVTDTLAVPADCAPSYDPPTPQKERMVKTVISTMNMLLHHYASKGIAKYPPEVKLLIANFNTDYHFTYVIVEPVKEVYSITLHDWDNYDSDEYERVGEYPAGAAYMDSISDSGLAEIRKNGIVRTITVAPQ